MVNPTLRGPNSSTNLVVGLDCEQVGVLCPRQRCTRVSGTAVSVLSERLTANSVPGGPRIAKCHSKILSCKHA